MAYVALVCAPGTNPPVSGRLRTIQLRVVKNYQELNGEPGSSATISATIVPPSCPS